TYTETCSFCFCKNFQYNCRSMLRCRHYGNRCVTARTARSCFFTNGFSLSQTYPANTEHTLRRTSSLTSGWKINFCRSPEYQSRIYDRNTLTPHSICSSYSCSQSTCSPANCRMVSFADKAPDSVAKQTPDEKTGSRNSAL